MTTSISGFRQWEARFSEALIEQLPALVVLLDMEGNLVYVSPQMAQALGRSVGEMEGTQIGRHVHPDDLHRAWSAFHRIADGRARELEIDVRLATRMGRYLSVAAAARKFADEEGDAGVLVSARDISAQEAAMEALGASQSALVEAKGRLAHVEKVESVGRLAGTVAHDFNNFILAIQGTVDLLLDEHGDGGSLAEDLHEIRKTCRRATALTSQLLSISRRQPVRRRIVEADAAVADLEPMLRRLTGDRIELLVEADAPGAGLRIDPNQLDQVLMNLVVNARDAIEGNGRVTVRTELLASEEPRQTVSGELAPGTWLSLSVRDDGAGMDPWTLARVFEPFFTTKAEGRGTGFGLSTVLAIVEQSGGRLDVTSEKGVGTTFEIFLPLLEIEASLEGDVPSPEHQNGRPAESGSATILVIDDDASVRRVIQRILERGGYDVCAAASSDEAVELAAAGTRLDLIVSDLMLPDGSGPEAVARIKEVTEVPALLFVSGFSDEEQTLPPDLAPVQDFRPKPFTPQQLLAWVHDLLQRAGRS